MIGDRDVDAMLPLAATFVAAVDDGDRAVMERVTKQIADEFNAHAPQALAVLCAELVLRERAQLQRARARLASANSEATKYAEAYLDQKRRVTELRDLLNQKVGASPGRQKKEAA